MFNATLFRKLLKTSIALSLSVSVCSQGLASSAIKSKKLKGSLEYHKYSRDFKIRGWKVAEGVYWGQAKIAGEYGVGLVVDRKGYSWGVNNRGIGFFKRF
jgi:hypothetical protein